MTYQHPDKIDMYAAALQSDIGAERFQQVVSSKLETVWIGTVYGGGVATNSRRARRHGTTLRILWFGARKLSVSASVAHKETTMLKLALQQRKRHPMHRDKILSWASCAPFVENSRGVLIHRLRRPSPSTASLT